MSSIDEQLAAEVDRIAVDVTTGRQAVRSRVRSRHHRRRIGAAVAMALVLVAVVGIAVLRSGGDRDQPVITGPGSTEPTPTSTSTPTSTVPTITTVPSASGVVPTVEVSPRPSDLTDGQVITLAGSGFPVGGHSEVVAYVCDGPDWATACDASRGARITAAVDGTISLRMRVFREMYNFPGWRSCASCVLRLTWNDGSVVLPALDIPVAFGSGGSGGSTAPRPTLAISGHADATIHSGETVTVTGSGFQLDQQLTVGVCQRAKLSACLIPNWGFTQADADGNVRATGALDAEFLTFCGSATACTFAVSQQEGLDPVVDLPFTLLGP